MQGVAQDVGQAVDANVPAKAGTVVQCHVVIDLLTLEIGGLRRQLSFKGQALAVLQGHGPGGGRSGRR